MHTGMYCTQGLLGRSMEEFRVGEENYDHGNANKVRAMFESVHRLQCPLTPPVVSFHCIGGKDRVC
jgi:hypothetical protein